MLKYLIEKEFKQLLRDSVLPRLILAFPIIMMLVTPWAANQEIRNIRLGVVDLDHSTTSDRLARKVSSSGYFLLTDVSDTYPEAMRGVEAGRADLILQLPDDFEKTLVGGTAGKVMVSVNSVNGTKGLLGSAYMAEILGDFSSELREEAGVEAGGADGVPAFRVIPQYKFNPHLDYKVFMVPALMVMLVTLLSGFLPAMNIVSEKEKGTIEQINVTPVGRLQFILAKLIPYWTISLIVLTLCFGLAMWVYSLVPVGSLLTVYFFALIYILAVSGMGLVISNYSETMQQAMFVMFFFIMILLLMSGLLTPVESMPGWAQTITVFNPLKYFMQVMRMVYLKGSSFHELLPQFFALCGFALALNAWAVLSYRKNN